MGMVLQGQDQNFLLIACKMILAFNPCVLYVKLGHDELTAPHGWLCRWQQHHHVKMLNLMNELM